MKLYIAHKIFTILEELGANEHERYTFTSYMEQGGREFRFGGQLGFGGKFYRSATSYRVGYHPQDFSHEPERMKALDELVKNANAKLAQLFAMNEEGEGQC